MADSRITIETTITACALLGAGLLVAPIKERRRVSDLAILGAFVSSAVTALTFSVLPTLAGSDPTGLGAGAHVGSEMLLTTALVTAAVLPSTTLGRSRRGVVGAASAGLAAIALAELVDVLPTGAPEAVVLACAALLVAAGIRFTASGDRPHLDAGLLGGAALLLGAATLQHQVASSRVTLAEALQLLAYAFLAVFAFRRHSAARHAAATAAIRAERKHIARDLHDGLAQDLAFIAANGERLASELGAEDPLTVAARRALAASRGVIVDLAASNAPTTAAALQQVGNEVGKRFGVEVDVQSMSAPDDGELEAPEREEVVRIAREAIVNAARHGRARHVRVELGSRSADQLLRVSDDGCGIREGTETESPGGGFGLETMHARAATLGRRLVARPRAGGGTEVEVLVL